MSSSSSQPRNSTSPTVQWDCPACTLLNAPGAFKCEACGTARGTSRRRNAAVIPQQARDHEQRLLTKSARKSKRGVSANGAHTNGSSKRVSSGSDESLEMSQGSSGASASPAPSRSSTPVPKSTSAPVGAAAMKKKPRKSVPTKLTPKRERLNLVSRPGPSSASNGAQKSAKKTQNTTRTSTATSSEVYKPSTSSPALTALIENVDRTNPRETIIFANGFEATIFEYRALITPVNRA